MRRLPLGRAATSFAGAIALVLAACGGSDTAGVMGANGAGGTLGHATGSNGGSATGSGGASTTDPDATSDADKDTISDADEGRAQGADTDGDKKPDYLDPDSDDDGLPDAIEAGDADLATPPVDTDGDGVPNFRDRDSDGDGLLDGEEDKNHDGKLDPGETSPTSADTDKDGASDLLEKVAGTDPRDPKDNPAAHGNFVFLEPYEKDESPKEGELHFATSIRKVDLYFLEDVSISMDAELLAIHDNVVKALEELTCDAGETGQSCAKDCAASCGNAACDAGETAASCPVDCLGVCGDGVCLGNETPATCPKDCPATCGNGACDAGETGKSCPSDCKGTCGDGACDAGEQAAITGCVADIQTGAGVYGTASKNAACVGDPSCTKGKNGKFVYENLIDIQPSSAATQTVLPSDCWGSGCWEPGLAATFMTVTGWGTQTAIAKGYTMPPLEVPDPPACPAGYRGTPCFRPDSLPILLLIGDESMSQCYLPAGPQQGNCVNGPSKAMAVRDFHEVSDAVNALGAKIIGVQGNGGGKTLTADFEQLCKETGSLDANGQPLVLQGAGAAAGDAIAKGVHALATSTPVDMRARFFDDGGDAVDTKAAFLDHVDTFDPGTPECAVWPQQKDGDPDGHPDTYLGVKPGTPVCWKLFAKKNTTVKPTDTVQIFQATAKLDGNGVIDLDTRKVYFVVPPKDLSGPVVPK
jgi:hypothetical protein